MAEVTAMRNNCTPYPLYGVSWTVVAPLLDADGDPISPSSPDSEVSKNGDTFADCTNEATEIATSSGVVYLTLTASEMTADIVTVRIQSTGAKTTIITLYPRKLVAIASGTCQGSNDTGDIQLASGDSAIDDYYNGCICVAVIDGTTESRLINDYVGSTKVAEVSPAWNTAQPDSNDTYTIYLPEGRHVQQANASHWNGLVTVALPLTPATAGRSLVVDAAGLADANVVKLGPTGSGTAQTARDIGASVLLSSGTGTGQLDFTSGVVKSNVTQFNGSNATSASGRPEVNVSHFGGSAGTFSSGRPEVNTTHFGGSSGTFSAGIPSVNVTQAAGTAWNSGAITTGTFASGAINAAAIATDAITAAKIAADAIGASELATDAVTEIVSAIWRDTTAADFTQANSIGKSIMNGVALGTGLTINAYTGDTPQTGDCFARLTGTGTVTFASLTVTGAFTISDGLIVNAATTNRNAATLTGNGTGAGLSLQSGSGTGNNSCGALIVQSNMTNAQGVLIIGTGTGSGIKSSGGTTGNGAFFVGGGTSGDGMHCEASASGSGISATGVGSGDGMYLQGGATGSGLHGIGGASAGVGAYFAGGTGGEGMYVIAGADATGLIIYGGHNSGDGIKVYGSSTGTPQTGHGIYCLGGIGGGSGLYCKATGDGEEDSGIYATSFGALGSGAYFESKQAGHGLWCEAEGDGNAVHADAEGDGDAIHLETDGAGAGFRSDKVNVTGTTTLTGAVTASASNNIAGVKLRSDGVDLVTKFLGITTLARWLGAIMGKTADTTTRTEINATLAGTGYNETTDSQEAQRDNVGTAGAGLTAVSGGGVTVTPLQLVLTSGRVQQLDLDAHQFASLGSYEFTVTDSTGAAVNLSGKTVKLVAFDKTPTPGPYLFLVTGTVSGASSNIVTFSEGATNTQTARKVNYRIWNTTDNKVYSEGTLNIKPSPSGVIL